MEITEASEPFWRKFAQVPFIHHLAFTPARRRWRMAAKNEHWGLPWRRPRPIISGGYRERPVHNKGVAFGGVQVRPAPVVNITLTSIQYL